MNTVKTTLAALLLFTTMTAEKCAKSGGSAATITDTKWVVETVHGKAVTVPDGIEKPYIRVTSEGALTGFGGCNQLMGNAKVDGSKVEFPTVGSTKMFCEATQPVERELMSALREAHTFTLDGDKLTLNGASGEVATLVRGK